MKANFKELKRKDLQRLCKKHGLRANATNSQMVDSLVYLFKICEKNKEGNVSSKGYGGIGSSKVERVEGEAEKVVIVIDDDDGELGSVVRSADRKSSPKKRRSSEKDEQIEARLDGSSDCGGSKGTRVKWHVENSIILLDEKNDEPCPVLRSADRKKCRRSSRKVGKVCEPNKSNEENQHVGILRNLKEGLLVPVRTTRSRSMNSEVAHSPVIEKIKTRKDRQVARQNTKLPLDTSEFEGIEVGTRTGNPSVMMAAVEVKVKRRRKRKNSSMKVNDEIMVSFPIKVSVTENFVGDVVNEKHVNTRMGSAITFSIDGEQARQGTATRNEKDIEESELCTAGNLVEVVAGGVETKRGKKRTRAGLEEDSPVLEKNIDKLRSAHHPELLHTRENVEPEVCFASSQILESPPSSNPASSRPCLLFSELQGCQGVEAKQECSNFEEASGGEEEEKGNKLFEDHEVHKEKENGSESQEGYNDRITVNWEFENTFPVILRVESIIEDTSNIASPASERIDEMINSAPLSINIDRRDDYNLFYLAEISPETVGREESVDVQKQARDLKILADRCGVALEEKASIEFEYLAKTLKSPGLDISGNKFQQEANHGQAAITPTRKIEIESSDRHNKLELQELVIFRNSEVTRNTSAGEKNDSCHSQLCSSYTTEIFEVEQQLKASLSSEKEIIDPRNLIVSHIIDVSTIVSDHLVCSEFDGKDAESTKRRDHPENFSVSPDDIKMLGACKAHLDAVEMGDVKFLEINQSHGEPIEAEDGTAKENGSNLSPSGSDENTNVANFKEHYQIKGREPFKSEGGSEEPQAVGYDEHSEAKNFTGSPSAKVEETAPFGLHKRVDNLFEKLLCLKKVLRGEIVPVITDSSLPFEEELSCKVLHATSEKEMISGESFYSHDQESQILNALLPTDPVLEDCEQDSSNSKVNAPSKIDEVAIISSPDALQENPELWKCMKSCEGNNTDAASPYECDFYIRPTEGKLCQDGGVVDTKFLEIVQGVTARPGEVLEDIKFVSPGKLSCFDLEGERSSSPSCISNSKLNNNITNSPAKCINQFGTKRLSETLDAYSSLTSKQAYAKHTVDILKMESHEEVPITISSESLKGNLGLWKCMESCEANNTDARGPLPGVDIDVREFLKIEGSTTKPGEVLENIKFLSPSKQSNNDFEVERNFSTSLNNNITNFPGKDIKHFGAQCLSNTSDSDSSLPIKQAYAKHLVDILEVESQDGSIPGADILVDSVPTEVEASFGSNAVDPVEEITRKLTNFCVSSSRKAIKSNILNTPTTNSAGISAVGLIKDRENIRSTKMKNSSKPKIRKSASVRRPLQSVTNQMIE